MIGQFGRFDENKQERDFKDSFFGVEACLMESEEEINKLVKEAEDNNFNIGVHFPLRAGKWRLRDPQFLSKDEEVRESSYQYMRNEFEYLKKIKPKYVLMHYPKPVLLDDTVDWTNWRFADDTEYYFESKYSFEELKIKSEELFKYLTNVSIENNFIPVLELDALNSYIYDSDLLETLLNKYPRVKLCLDIGRLHLQDKLDKNFNSFEITRKLAKYAEVIHLWNVKVSGNLTNNHYPTLPNLKTEDGWADVRKYLSIIKEENENCKLLFEHRSDLITDEELESCYDWINELISK